MTSTTRLAIIGFILALAATASAIKCWQCGQYSDGVGSITPCANRTAAKLEECPSNAKYCIKYVSELTVVRDCVPTCSEKDGAAPPHAPRHATRLRKQGLTLWLMFHLVWRSLHVIEEMKN